VSTKLPAKLPESIEAFLEQRQVRSFEDVIDYASVCARAVSGNGLTAGASKELRLWGELMYTCIHSQNAGDNNVSVIGQLIQIAGNDAVGALTSGADLASTFSPTRGEHESSTAVEIDILDVEEDLIREAG